MPPVLPCVFAPTASAFINVNKGMRASKPKLLPARHCFASLITLVFSRSHSPILCFSVAAKARSATPDAGAATQVIGSKWDPTEPSASRQLEQSPPLGTHRRQPPQRQVPHRAPVPREPTPLVRFRHDH